MKTLFFTSLTVILVVHVSFAQKTPSTIAEWQQKLQTAKHDTIRLQCYARISELFYVSDSSLHYANIGLVLGKKYPKSPHNVLLLLNKYYSFTFQGKNDSALFYSQKAYTLAQQIKHDPLIKLSNHFLLVGEKLTKTVAQSIKSYYGFLQKYSFNQHNPNDKEVLLLTYNQIIKSQLSLGQIEKAYKTSDFTKQYMSTPIDSMRYVYTLCLIMYKDIQPEAVVGDGSIVKKLSIPYNLSYKTAEKIYSKHANLRAIGGCMRCMWTDINYGFSVVLNHEKKYSEAIKYAQKSLALSELSNTKFYTHQSYVSLGLSYNGLGDFRQAIFCLNKGFEIHEKGNFEKTLLIDNYFGLGEAYKGIGDYKKGFEYLSKAVRIKNEYVQTSQQKQVAEMEVLYELSEKQEQIIQQELQNKLKDERIKFERQQKYLFFGLMALGFTLLVFATWSYRKQRQLRQRLEIKKHTLEIKTQELSQTNQTKDKIFAVLGHDLRSPLNELKTILMLFHSKDITPNKMKELMASLTTKMEAVQGMMNNLLQWSLIELKQQPSSPKRIELTAIIQNIVLQLQTVATQKQITIETNLSPVQIEANAEDIEIIIRNILYNAIKYSSKGGTIRLNAVEEENQIRIIFTDNGIGIDTAILEAINHQLPSSTVGTAGETGSGIGLKISQELVQRNKGDIRFESRANKGTEVIVRFPK